MDPKQPQAAAHVCPFLGLQNDTETRYGFPSEGNQCHRERHPRTISLDYQENVCLTSGYVTCPIYVQKGAGLPAPPARDASGAPILPRQSLFSYGWFRLFVGLILVVGSLAGMYMLSGGAGGFGGFNFGTRATATPAFIPVSTTETATEAVSETPPPTETPSPATATSQPSSTATPPPSQTTTATITATPTATPTWTNVPFVPPPPTNPPPPTSPPTSEPPTATAPPPTKTPVPPTNTSPPPTNTPVPPTDTPISDLPTPTP